MSSRLPFLLRTRLVRAVDEMRRLSGITQVSVRPPPYETVFPDTHPKSPRWIDRPDAVQE